MNNQEILNRLKMISPTDHVLRDRREMDNNLTNDQRARLEFLADEVETVARGLDKGDRDKTALFAKAWDLKQMARRGTPSEGI